MPDWRTTHFGRPLKPENQYVSPYAPPDLTPRIRWFREKEQKMAAVEFREDQLGAVDMREAVEWVFQFVDHANITASDAPSAGAWSLIMWVRESTANRSEFYKTFAKALMPTKSQVDGGAGKLVDDGRATIALAERMAAAMGGDDDA